MVPGIKSGVDISVLGPEEVSICRSFSNQFFVTWAKNGLWKQGSTYPYFFGIPSEDLKENFGFQREVLFVFSPFSSFDGRSFDFVDKTLHEFTNRLDRLCVVLISKDPHIQEEIAKLLAQNQHQRLYVPFSYTEIGPTFGVNEISGRFRKILFNRDLFDVGSPITSSELLFGRSQLIQELNTRFTSGTHSGVFGLRKIGKTSILNALFKHAKDEEHPTVFLDCQSPSFYFNDWTGAIKLVVEQSYKQNGIEVPDFKYEEYSYINCAHSLEKHLGLISRASGGKRIFLCFDEIEHITPGVSAAEAWSDEQNFIHFWRALRSLAQAFPNLLGLVISGTNPKAVETVEFFGSDNPIYQFIRPYYLEPLDKQSNEKMISTIGRYMGVLFKTEVIEQIYTIIGGHPFLARQACSYLFRSLPHGRTSWSAIDKTKFEGYKTGVVRHISGYVDVVLSVLKNFYSDEYEMLQLLACGDEETFQYFEKESGDLVQHLVGYGIIFRQHDGNYKFRLKLVEESLAAPSEKKGKKENSNSADLVEDPFSDQRSRITKRRNRIEINLRNVIKSELSKAFRENAREKFLAAIPSERRKKLNFYTYDDLYWCEDFYFMDAVQIILKYWENPFGEIFGNEKKSFEEYGKTINELRNDAHPNPIDENDWGDFVLSCRWIERHLKKYFKTMPL